MDEKILIKNEDFVFLVGLVDILEDFCYTNKVHRNLGSETMKKEGTEEGRGKANKPKTSSRTNQNTKGTTHKKEEGQIQSRIAKTPRKKQLVEEKTEKKRRTKTPKETQMAKAKQPIQKRNTKTSKAIQEERPVQNRTSRTKREAQRIEEMTIQIQKATHNQEHKSLRDDDYIEQQKNVGVTSGRPRTCRKISYQ